MPRTQLDGLFVGRFEWKVRSTPGPCHQRFTWIRVDVGARGQRSAGLAPVSPGLQAPEGAWGGGVGGAAGLLMFLLLQIPQLRRNEEARRPVWGSGLLGGSGLERWIFSAVSSSDSYRPSRDHFTLRTLVTRTNPPADRWLVDSMLG